MCPAQPQGLDVTFKDKGTAVRTRRECTMPADAICRCTLSQSVTELDSGLSLHFLEIILGK